MSIRRVALRLQSESMSAQQLSRLVDRVPSRSTERGAPVSSRNQRGPVHTVSTVTFVVDCDGDELSLYVDEIRSDMRRLESARLGKNTFFSDVVVAATSRDTGFLMEVTESQLALLAAAGCGLVIDMYTADDDPS